MDIGIKEIIKDPLSYNLHSHTQFCDGRNSMDEIASSARKSGIIHLGFTPHCPVPLYSPCNMDKESVEDYFHEIERLKEKYEGEMNIYRSMEIDYFGDDFGAHIDYFQKLPLEYRLSSVHFVPTQNGDLIDCDGSAERFKENLKNRYHGDLRYVVEKYFEQVLRMIERGGFDILGHFDKIAANASSVQPDIEEEGWYVSLIDDMINHVEGGDIFVEINTKSYEKNGRFFPCEKWWSKLNEAGITPVINSDVHFIDKIQSGRKEAIEKWREVKLSD